MSRVAERGTLGRLFLAPLTKSRIEIINSLGRNCQAVPLLGDLLDRTIDEILINSPMGFLFIGLHWTSSGLSLAFAAGVRQS